jgi:hypothetical protein
MNLSTREIMLAWATCVLLLVGVTYLLGKPHVDTLLQRGTELARLDAEIERNLGDIALQPQWEERLNALRQTIQPIPPGQDAKSYLIMTIGNLATKHGVRVKDFREGKKETQSGVNALRISCPWTASTEGIRNLLIDFLSHDVMFDITDLSIRSDGRDNLSGSFTVRCVFTQQENNPEG